MIKKFFRKKINWKKTGKRSAIVVIAGILFFFLLNLLFPLPDKIAYSTLITDNKGEMMNAYLTPDEKWRMYTSLEEISPLLRKTIIAKEDQYFYYHPGINPLAMLRAAVKNIWRLKRTSGASTITMQVARALEPGKRTYWKKMAESFRALQLEWKYSKNEILQLYLNLVPYGGNIEGVKAASLLYFKKNPNHLSLAEITALSIIPNRPSSLVMGKNNDLIMQERNRWLQKFAAEAVFTPKEIEDALNEPLNASRTTVPHYAPHLSYQLKKNGHPVIHSSIDLNTQLKAEKIVADYIRAQRLRNIKNAAVVIIDNRTNNVIAYIGSADFTDSTDGGQVNGVKAVRQPGSTLKPLLYGLCFDEGILTPKTIMTDVPVNYAGYAPENYDKKFNGYVSAEYALEHSLNIPAVKGLQQLGTERMIQKLVQANFQQIAKDRRKLGLSLILGGCGTTLEELTGLFAAFARNGSYQRPSYTIADSMNNRFQLLSPAATFMLNDILSKVNRPDFPLNWSATERMPKIAWKTGTSYGRRDAWSIGYNKHYTIGVWTGNFSGAGTADLNGSAIATPLLFRLFNTVDYNNEKEWFSPPEDIDFRQVCSETGLPPAEYCTHIITDYFIPLISTTLPCNNQQEVLLSADEQMSYCKSCAPEAGYKKKRFRIISPDMQHWYNDNHIRYEKIPMHNPSCEQIFKSNAPVIISPKAGMEYLISKKNPEPIQLSVKTANDADKVYWYINNRFYKTAAPSDKQFFLPEEGLVKISCSDDKGRTQQLSIQVKYVDL